MNFDKKLSLKPVELVLDGWSLEGYGSNSNFEHTLILRIGSNSVVSYSSASSFPTFTSNIYLTISNFSTTNGAALKFSNSVAYWYGAYNSVLYYGVVSGFSGFPLRGLKIVNSNVSIVQDLVTINDNWWDSTSPNISLEVSDFIFEKSIYDTLKYVVFSTKVITEEDISFINSKIVIYPSPFSNLKRGINLTVNGSSVSDISSAISSKFSEDNSILVIKPNISPLFEFKGQKMVMENCTVEVLIPGAPDQNLKELVQTIVHIFKVNTSSIYKSYSVTFRDNYFRFPIVEKSFSCSSTTNCEYYYWVYNSNYYSILNFILFNADEADTKPITCFFSGNSIEIYTVSKQLSDFTYRDSLNYRLLSIVGRYLRKELIPEATNKGKFDSISDGYKYRFCWDVDKVKENSLVYIYNSNDKTVIDKFSFRPYLSTTCSNTYCSFTTTFNHLNSLFLV